jgi:hypothetical protein
VDAVFIGEVAVAAKRHITQVIEQLFVRSDCQFVEDCPQLVVLPSVDVHGDSIALSRWTRTQVETTRDQSGNHNDSSGSTIPFALNLLVGSITL